MLWHWYVHAHRSCGWFGSTCSWLTYVCALINLDSQIFWDLLCRYHGHNIYIFYRLIYIAECKLRLIQLSTPIYHHTCSLVGTLRTSSYFCSSRINVNLGDISIERISVQGPFIPSCKWSRTPLQRKPQGRASLWIGSQVSVNLCTSTRPGHQFCAIYLISCLDHLSFVRSFLDIQRRGKSVVTINESITAKLRMTSLVGIHVDVSTFSFFNQPMSNSLNPTL